MHRMENQGIERYLKIRSAHSPSVLSNDDILFLMDVTGTKQIWRLGEPMSWPEQVTYFDEPVSYLQANPVQNTALFGMDRGGNEMHQLYLLEENQRIKQLTNEPESKHIPGTWSPDGNRIPFTSNRRDPGVFDVHLYDVEEDEEHLLTQTNGWFVAGDWSPDGESFILKEARSNFDNSIYRLDTETGEKHDITPSNPGTRYTSINWIQRDKILLITDLDSDKLYIARLDLEAKDIEEIEIDSEWDITGLTVDDDDNAVISRNIDGYTELSLATVTEDAYIEQISQPELPHGIIGGSSHHPDKECIAVTATTDTMNPNVFILEPRKKSVSQWTDASTAGIPKNSFRESRLIRYESFDDLEIPAFYSTPEETHQPYPVIIDIHGGPESQRRPSFSSVKQFFLSEGYAVLEPNVRGSTGYGREYTHLDDVGKRMDSVRDIKEAVEWLSLQDEVDQDRIAVKGGSYGGFMVLASMSEYPDLFSAGIDIVGIANFITFLENTGEWRRKLREAEYGSLDEHRDLLREISPINNAHRISSPLMVLHGANDPRVPVEEAEQIAEEVSGRGVPVEKVIFEDEGHGFSKLENQIEAYTRMVDFLDMHL